MTVEVGDIAPDFTLTDQNRESVTLSSFRGKSNVVIVFYPFTFTSVCEGEMCALRDDLDGLSGLDAEVLAISCDSPFAHKVWADQENLAFALLADFWPHGAVAKAYGVFNEDLGAAMRGTFIVNTEGKIAYKVENPIAQARSVDAYKDALAELA